MAARWGVGEETLTACNMDFFSIDTLDEASGLSSGETLETLQSCIDPSILSIFEDMPTIETKGLDEENEATLLTALTEILDNVDDENLSPFDTLPESDLLSNQKGREHSPLRRLLCLSRSPPEKDSICSARPLSTGKSIPRMQPDSVQRSDGEEEDDNSLTLSPVTDDSSPHHDLSDWDGLTLPLPVTFEQGIEDGLSVSLGDLVRHMHPYCMAICVENEDGEQMLPEGGILLEVVDQAENGEPILAIPDMGLPLSLPEQSTENEQEVSSETAEAASDCSEHIVVDDDEDDDVTATEAAVKVAASASTDLCTDVKDEMTSKRQKEEIKEKIQSHRKKKKKCKEHPEPVEGRVLRSGTVRKMVQEKPKKPEKRSAKEEKKLKVPKVPLDATLSSSSAKPKEVNPCQTETQTGIPTTTLLPEVNVQTATPVSPRQDTVPLNISVEKSQPSCSPTTLSFQQHSEIQKQPAPDSEKLEESSADSSAVLPLLPADSPAAAASPITPQMVPPVSEALPSVAPAVPEPKPKSLSLEEYRRLRQQKKPAPVEKQDSNSTKWPSLQDLPKELPPIPCLHDLSPKDRRTNTQTTKKEVEDVKPAWQPRGPAAPPTPEALLVPPAYMVASSNKLSATTPVPKPQQTPEPSKFSPATAPNSLEGSSIQQHTTVQPAVPVVPLSSGSPVTLKVSQFKSATDEKLSPVLARGNGGVSQSVSLKSAVLKTCPETTTEVIKPTAATVSAPSAPQKTTVSQRVPEVTAATSLNNAITLDSKYSKRTANSNDLSASSAAHSSESHSLKKEPVVLETKKNPTTALKPQKPKCPTQELIEAFTSEIGIEAADLTSLLEQFEETQAKEEQCVPEVSGRAAAVGNSSFELAPEKMAVERVRANDLSSTAALTPPATPPHQMWKPLAPMALLGKSKSSEVSKLSPSKVIQIEARPLPSVRFRSKPTPASATIAPNLACMDHDYCLPNKGTLTGEPGKRWNVKRQSFITIKPMIQSTAATTQQTPAALASSAKVDPAVTTKTPHFPLAEPLDHSPDGMERNSVLETPDASPARQETESAVKEGSPRRGPSGRSYRQHAASRISSPKERTGARSRKRSHRSPSPMSSSSESDSHSSRSRSRSHSPSKKRYRPRLSESSSSSSSRYSSSSSPSVSRSPPRRRRYSYSSSRSGSWSRSRSRSRSPDRRAQWSASRRLYSQSSERGYGQSAKTGVEEVKKHKEKAIEERRVVYVGRIRGTMTQKELRERFSLFGEIEDCTLHFRNHGDNYGFVTYYSTKDAFSAIENGSKLRKPDELPFDLCFGGRRQFCKSSYSDLDSNREYDPFSAKSKFHALDFDALLKQAQQNLKR